MLEDAEPVPDTPPDIPAEPLDEPAPDPPPCAGAKDALKATIEAAATVIIVEAVLVSPEPQRRGRLRTHYTGTTLRENLLDN
jgi:hypothetical protein